VNRYYMTMIPKKTDSIPYSMYESLMKFSGITSYRNRFQNFDISYLIRRGSVGAVGLQQELNRYHMTMLPKKKDSIPHPILET